MKYIKYHAIVTMPSNDDIRSIADIILNTADEEVSIEDRKEQILNMINETIKVTVIGERKE